MQRYVHDRITIDPDLCNGRPTIRGMRITVATILDFLAAGDTMEDMLDEYPSLVREDILACMHFALVTMQERYEPQVVLR